MKRLGARELVPLVYHTSTLKYQLEQGLGGALPTLGELRALQPDNTLHEPTDAPQKPGRPRENAIPHPADLGVTALREPRRCLLCREVGHDKRKCPSLNAQ